MNATESKQLTAGDRNTTIDSPPDTSGRDNTVDVLVSITADCVLTCSNYYIVYYL